MFIKSCAKGNLENSKTKNVTNLRNVKETRDKVLPALEVWREDYWIIVHGIRGDADFDVLGHLEKYAEDLDTIIKLAKEIEA